MPDSLTGKQIILVGGSGGLGAATASLLAEQEPHLIVSYRSNRERAALQPASVQADITRPEDRTRLLDCAPQLYGLVIFAGDPVRHKTPADLEAMMDRSHQVNYSGPILLARAAADRMRASNTNGAIVLFATMQAISVFPNSTAYAGAKAALIHSALILAKECRAANIRVNVIAPGVMAAGMAESSIASGKYQHFIDQGIIPRYGRAADVARTVRFLLEPDNYITGQVLAVDGGASLG